MSSLQGRQVAALACFDSFGKTAMNLLQVARQHGADTTLILLELPGRKLSRRQVLEIRRIDPRTEIRQREWPQLRSLRSELATSTRWCWASMAAHPRDPAAAAVGVGR
jgi:hypothetical protein